MIEITGALRIIISIVVLTLMGVLTTFLIVFNAHKKEIEEAIYERIKK
jgi:hypothetical protein